VDQQSIRKTTETINTT